MPIRYFLPRKKLTRRLRLWQPSPQEGVRADAHDALAYNETIATFLKQAGAPACSTGIQDASVPQAKKGHSTPLIEHHAFGIGKPSHRAKSVGLFVPFDAMHGHDGFRTNRVGKGAEVGR